MLANAPPFTLKLFHSVKWREFYCQKEGLLPIYCQKKAYLVILSSLIW